MTTKRRRPKTTETEIVRAKRAESAPPSARTAPKMPLQVPDWATTIRDMPAVAPKQTPIPSKARRSSRPQSVTRSDPRRRAVTRPEVPRAKTRGAVNDPPPSLVLPAPDPSAARYSVIPQRAASAVRFPTLAQYLEKLPKGLESHAALRVKGAIVRRLILDPVHALPLGVGLPEVLEGLVRAPPSANDWAPTVQLFSLHAAMFDSAFAGKGGTRAYEEWTFERDLRLFKTDAFRALVAVEGPERLLTNYAARWSAFHRGTTLNVMHVSKAKVAIRLSYPAHSWPPISCLALAGAFRAAVVVAGAKEGEVTFTDDSPAASSFDISWR